MLLSKIPFAPYDDEELLVVMSKAFCTEDERDTLLNKYSQP